MIRHLSYFRTTLPSLLILALCPVVAHAETLAFRNDTTSPVVVQAAHVVQGTVQRDRPRLLQPSEACQVALSGKKLIFVYNAKMPNHVLYQTTFPAASEDRSYSIRHDATLGKMVIEQIKSTR